MGYDGYTDRNGVAWFVYSGDQGWKMAAGVKDEVNPQYAPPPPDLVAEMGKGGLQIFGADIVKSDPPTAQQRENLFLDLRRQIDEYATAHKSDVVLRVTSKPDNGGAWVIAAAIILALLDEG